MKVFLERNNEEMKIKFSGSVKKLLLRLNINPETVLVTKNGNLTTETEKLNNTDEIKILSVISGG